MQGTWAGFGLQLQNKHVLQFLVELMGNAMMEPAFPQKLPYYPLVNVNKKLWKDPPSLIGKTTISMGHLQ